MIEYQYYESSKFVRQNPFQAFSKHDEKTFVMFFDNFVTRLKHKKHYKLLPQIYLEAKRMLEDTGRIDRPELLVREAKMAEIYKAELEKYQDLFGNDFDVKEEPNIVGGYIAQNGKNRIDNSYRSRLLAMYRKLASL